MQEHREGNVADPFRFDKVSLGKEIMVNCNLNEVSREVCAAGHQNLPMAIIKSGVCKGCENVKRNERASQQRGRQ